MRTLLIDIEVSPALVLTFDLKNAYIGPEQIVNPPRILCFAYEWAEDENGVEWVCGDDLEGMVLHLWQLLDQADAVVHWYGKRFDIPHIRREFWQADMIPPSPFRQIDLWETVRKQFLLPSNKLAYLGWLLQEPKMSHSGFTLWKRCLDNETAAWQEMAEYNKQDVTTLKAAFESLKPWITTLPNAGAYTGETVCPECGGFNLIKQGHSVKQTRRYQRWQCKDCGRWSRSTKSEDGTGLVSDAA